MTPFLTRPLTTPFLTRPLMTLCLLVASLLTLSGCGYYAQSIQGQWSLVSKREPISDLLADPDTPSALRDKLQRSQQMRDFAVQQLALPDNGSYREYADLGRPFVVWNVFASQPLSMSLKTWCFPIAGCVGYRGYFAKADAQAFAAELRAQGLETYVAGIAAYSTLGWFDDPLLNTLIGRSEARLAGLMFHELAHQQLYVKGDTAFNEAFASTVEQEGVRRWLDTQGDPAQRAADAGYRQRQADFVSLVTAARDRLAKVYGSAQSDAEKHQSKAQVIASLRADYARLKTTQWAGYSGYDAWFGGELNNPQLSAVTTYRDGVPAFQTLLVQQGGDLVAFYAAVTALGDLPMDERQARLQALSVVYLSPMNTEVSE